jgi:hypothetical protein
MSGLTDLVLQGRMCSASDSGLLALSGLTNLHSLAISWVPWQSQITQVGHLLGCRLCSGRGCVVGEGTPAMTCLTHVLCLCPATCQSHTPLLTGEYQ